MLPLVVSGPSGVGKSSLLRRLLKEYSANLRFSVSCTTRAPRPGELHACDYYFVSREEFASEEGKSAFVETAEVHGERYGTMKVELDRRTDGRVAVLDIDVQGVKQLWRKAVVANFVFVEPSDLSLMESRLRQRKTESEQQIQSRLSRAHSELAFMRENRTRFAAVLQYDYLLTSYPAFLRILQPMYGFVKLPTE